LRRGGPGFAPLHELLEQLAILFDAAGALGGVAARSAWNSPIAGFGEASLIKQGGLIDCATLENVDVDGSPRSAAIRRRRRRTCHESRGADGGGEAAARPTPSSTCRFVHQLGIEGMAQRIGDRASGWGRRHRRKRRRGARVARSRPFT
jgi:hypothetical protein